MKVDVRYMLVRYVLLLLIGMVGISFFYYVFFNLTFLPVVAILKLFYPALTYSVIDHRIVLGDMSVLIIDACIAGAAYYLLLMLNLTTPMSLKSRIKDLIVIVVLFYIVNLGRITVFAALYFENFIFFDITHVAFWYFGSTVLVIMIWFASAHVFKIEHVPVYTDVMTLLHLSRKKRNK